MAARRFSRGSVAALAVDRRVSTSWKISRSRSIWRVRSRSDCSAGEAVSGAVGLGEGSAGALAEALTGGVAGAGVQSKGRAAHLLRFAHHDPEVDETGGYSLVVIG